MGFEPVTSRLLFYSHYFLFYLFIILPHTMNYKHY